MLVQFIIVMVGILPFQINDLTLSNSKTWKGTEIVAACTHATQHNTARKELDKVQTKTCSKDCAETVCA